MKSLHNQKLCVILQANANKSGIGSTSKVNLIKNGISDV